MFALRMAQVFPDLEDYPHGATTVMPWDSENEFVCTNLAVYFEVHKCDTATATWDVIHPDSVELLQDQASCMRYYESA
jgi:hypothetical protein